MQLFAVFYLGLQCGREGGQAGGPRRPLAEMPHLRLRLPRLVALLKHVSALTHWYCGPHASIDSTGIMNLQTSHCGAAHGRHMSGGATDRQTESSGGANRQPKGLPNS